MSLDATNATTKGGIRTLARARRKRENGKGGKLREDATEKEYKNTRVGKVIVSQLTCRQNIHPSHPRGHPIPGIPLCTGRNMFLPGTQ